MERVVLPRDLAACCVRQFQFAPILLGYPVIGIWFWYCDQTIVQRVLAAKDDKNAGLGALFCAFLKIWPIFLFVLSGVMCVALVQKGHLAEPTPQTASGAALVILKSPMSAISSLELFSLACETKRSSSAPQAVCSSPFFCVY